jgi:hypothetical protein
MPADIALCQEPATFHESDVGFEGVTKNVENCLMSGY